VAFIEKNLKTKDLDYLIGMLDEDSECLWNLYFETIAEDFYKQERLE
jgi:hypothetical protein